MTAQCHQTQLARVHPSGAEEWHCPTCGRRVILQWQPFKWMVLEVGDDAIAHSGCTGGLRISAMICQSSDFIPDDDTGLNELLDEIDVDGKSV